LEISICSVRRGRVVKSRLVLPALNYGPSWEFYLAVPLKKLADLDDQNGPWQNATKAFGEEESRALQATLQKRGDNLVVNMTTTKRGTRTPTP